MENLKKTIGEHTFLVIDNNRNRFNFSGLIEVTPELAEMSEHAIAWDLTEDLPDDVRRAIDVMAENDVELEDFTGIIRFERDDDTCYVLVWA